MMAACSSRISCWWSLVGIGLKFEIREFGRDDPASLIDWKFVCGNWCDACSICSLKSNWRRLISGRYGGIADGLRDFCVSLLIFEATTILLSRWTTIRMRLPAARNRVCASAFRMSRASYSWTFVITSPRRSLPCAGLPTWTYSHKTKYTHSLHGFACAFI